MIVNNSQSSKYKPALVGKTADDVNNTNSFVKNIKIVVSLKYLCNFWRSLEMPLINCKIHLELHWIEDRILSSTGDSTKFKKTDAKLHVPIVTLPTKDNANLTKQLNNGFKISAYWSIYQTIPAKVINQGTNIYYNLLIDERNFYDQSINDLIKQYDEVRKVSTGQGDDYTTGCLLDYAYLKDNNRITAINLSKQEALDADPRAI